MADTKISALTALTSADDADLLAIVDDPSGTPATKKITVADLRAAMALPVLHVRDQKASGTDGGGASATTWNVRDLNTEAVNQITGASLSSNQVTLPAGTYRIRARAPAKKVRAHQLRWRNVTDASTTAVGSTVLSEDEATPSNDSVEGYNDAVLWGRFTIAAEKTFELQHYTELAQATNGFGHAVSSGEVEVYSEVWIEKEV